MDIALEAAAVANDGVGGTIGVRRLVPYEPKRDRFRESGKRGFSSTASESLPGSSFGNCDITAGLARTWRTREQAG